MLDGRNGHLTEIGVCEKECHADARKFFGREQGKTVAPFAKESPYSSAVYQSNQCPSWFGRDAQRQNHIVKVSSPKADIHEAAFDVWPPRKQ